MKLLTLSDVRELQKSLGPSYRPLPKSQCSFSNGCVREILITLEAALEVVEASRRLLGCEGMCGDTHKGALRRSLKPFLDDGDGELPAEYANDNARDL